ncbi:MAG: zinc metallopeptidase [Pseudomonadota bacterium]
MPYVLILLLLLGLFFGPGLWARYTFKRYSTPRKDIPGTGGELARHLLDRFGMQSFQVEVAGTEGDHFDPTSETVRLSQDNYDGTSLTAVAVAAHEVGHAIQHHRGEHKLKLRTRLAQTANSAQKIGAVVILFAPVVALLSRAPSAMAVQIILGLGTMLLATIVHLVTLPVEFDASFGKALPILKEGYVQPKDLPKIKRILRAAALTYVAASLSSLLSLGRWIAILRR